jgi:uncharacterized protein (DUF433 family)
MYNEELKTELFDWNGCKWVESVPTRVHGTPVVINSRMPADGVLVNFDEGMTIEELMEYGISREEIIGILEFAGRLRKAHAA